MGKEISLKDINIAVTGGTGFLGKELVKQLLEVGVLPTIIVRTSKSLEKLYDYLGHRLEFIIHETELTNPVELTHALQNIDLLFHCAASVSLNDGTDSLVAINTDIANHIVNSCLEAGVNKLIHVSSVAALGSAPGKVTDENSYPENFNGWTSYAISKFYSENEIWHGYNNGLKTVIVNPSVILGPGNWNEYGTPLLFATLAKGIPVFPTGGTGFVDVRDVASAMLILSQTRKAIGKRFILNSENLSFKELISLITASVGKKPPRYQIGPNTLIRLSKICDILSRTIGRENFFSGTIAHMASSETKYSNSALTELTGFRFRPVRETINYMAEQYKKDKHK